MKKAEKASSSKLMRVLMAVIGALLLIIAILFLARGWLRMTVAPRVVETLYGNVAQKTYEDEASKLQDPLALLGYQDARPAIAGTGCHTMLANGLKTQVSCSYSYNLTREIPQNGDEKQTLITNTEKLQALLQANGWQGEYSTDGEYTSLVKHVSSLTSGIDYQPDATYQKQVSEVECMFGNNTAFSSPGTPQMSTQIHCSRTINLFGESSWN